VSKTSIPRFKTKNDGSVAGCWVHINATSLLTVHAGSSRSETNDYFHHARIIHHGELQEELQSQQKKERAENNPSKNTKLLETYVRFHHDYIQNITR
jgi:hypothetical protein